ncbi:MAG: precorrin-8X methylmutase [Lachnospiraceae bacterium]|nr:precorrin-8X methylmutase [Candidatus Equihabitans merdae]
MFKENAIIEAAKLLDQDPELEASFCFSEDAIESGLDVLGRQALMVADMPETLAALCGSDESGKNYLENYNGRAVCFATDSDVAHIARTRKKSRAAVGIQKAGRSGEEMVLVIGSSLSALAAAGALIEGGFLRPGLVIVTVKANENVGPEQVTALKQQFMQLETPYIVVGGDKGGPEMAAAICGSLIDLLNIDEA